MPKCLEKNRWKVQPDTTLQVVNPHGIKRDAYVMSRNWYGILISLGIIFSVGIMVTIAAFLVIPFQTPPFYGRSLTLEDLSDPKLRAAPLGSQWLSDFEFAYISENDGLLIMNIKTNTTTQLVSTFTLQQIQAKEFSVSSNRLYILLTHDIDKGRLFKQTAKYSIYDLSKHHYFPLKLSRSTLEHPTYQHVRWLKRRNGKTFHMNSKIKTSSVKDSQEPGNKTNPLKNNQKLPIKIKTLLNSVSNALSTGSELIVIHGNNIYYKEHPKGPSAVQITDDGMPNEVFNGIPNIMNEEIMKSSSCLWPNPDGNLLAYASFVDTKVQQLPVIEYGTDGNPQVLSFRYPTVTSVLPDATIWIADISSKRNISKWRLVSPLRMLREEHYIVAVGWVHRSKIWVSDISRDQSTSHLMTCEGQNWKCTTVHVNHLEGGISPTIQSVVWLDGWAAFPWPLRTVNGWWYNQVTLVGVDGKKHPTFTLVGCHVKEVLATNPTQTLIYFLGSKLSEGTETQSLYSVTSSEDSLTCISCSIGCAKVRASFNFARTQVIITCIGTHLPTMHLVDLRQVKTSTPLHMQPSLRKEIEKIALPISIYKEFYLSPSVHASVTLSLPPGWIKDDDTFFYPLVIQIYGIELYEETDVEHQIAWQDLLASGHYIAHARIKVWGSISSNHEHSIQTLATQIGDVIRTILQERKYLDSSHITVWGWGSGASIALKLSELNIMNLKCVMAVNPVMDWKLYGSYWSERLLGSLYSEGATGRYEESKMRASDSLNNGTQILLMQSTKDPLAHHSSAIARELIAKGVYFQHIVYPDSTIALRKERSHVIKSFQSFLKHHHCVKSFYL